MKKKYFWFSLLILLFMFTVVACVPKETNNPPTWQSIPNQNIRVGERVSINLLNYASDPDGDQLTFEIITGEGNISGSTYTYRGESEGRETVPFLLYIHDLFKYGLNKTKQNRKIT